MGPPKKEFVIKHSIEYPKSLEEGKEYSIDESHFNIPWRLKYKKENGFLSLDIECLKSDGSQWSIETKTTLKVLLDDQDWARISENFKYFRDQWESDGWDDFIRWDTLMDKYIPDFSVIIIEAHVVIDKMSGCGKEDLRAFDESVADCSDVVLVVKERKFYLSKMFLALQSPYFKALLLGNFDESKQSEVVLKDIEPEDFQNYLELIHGESSVDDNTVEGILHISDMYNTPTATRRSEEFLLKGSEMAVKEKLGLACRYKLKTLKEKCLLEVRSVEEFRSAVPSNLKDLDQPEVIDLLERLLKLA